MKTCKQSNDFSYSELAVVVSNLQDDTDGVHRVECIYQMSSPIVWRSMKHTQKKLGLSLMEQERKGNKYFI